jgi:hypothetical protein
MIRNNRIINQFSFPLQYYHYSESARHRSQDFCPPISQIVLKNFIKISFIIKEAEILLKVALNTKNQSINHFSIDLTEKYFQYQRSDYVTANYRSVCYEGRDRHYYSESNRTTCDTRSHEGRDGHYYSESNRTICDTRSYEGRDRHYYSEFNRMTCDTRSYEGHDRHYYSESNRMTCDTRSYEGRNNVCHNLHSF